MVVLALDTATRQGSAALRIGAACDVTAGDAARTHGERLPRELLTLLDGRGLTPHDVDVFAVVSGPGSFTGLRVGMAAMQGLALTTGKRVVAVPTLEAMAEDAAQALGRTALERGLVCAIDGQRGDVFYSAWLGGQSVIEPSVGTPDDLVGDVRRAGIGSGGPAVVMGIGLERHETALSVLGVPVQAMTRTLAEIAAAIAAGDPTRAAPPHALRPLYIRRPDAVLARERAGLVR